ncbi:MAG TPA: NADH-quinone oxidoreductase subunit C [Rhodothermales bacterium]|nr:NADH-quinone oxidoreductase subunit C [Rhodothermales bacterium]
MPRDASKNATTKLDSDRSHQALKFYFTPVDPPRPGPHENPHAKGTTFVPEVVEALQARFGDDVLGVAEYANEHTVLVRKGRIVEVCRFLKEEQGFAYLSDLGGADRFTEEDRFELIYNLVNIQDRKRIRIKTRVDEEELEVDSITPVYRAANWNEREVIDMLGIRFKGHPDPRRMFMPEDFEYYPLRKEFPLLGIPGSLPLPPQTPEGPLTMDPYAAAHGSKPVKSYEEPTSDMEGTTH